MNNIFLVSTPIFQAAFLFFALVFIVAFLLFNVVMMNAMKEVREEDRTLGAPGLIWLNLIPIPYIGFIWTMVFGINVCKGLDKRIGKKVAPSQLSIAYPIIFLLAGIIMQFVGDNAGANNESIRIASLVGFALLLLAIVFWVLFWVKLHSTVKRAKNEENDVPKSDDLLDSSL